MLKCIAILIILFISGPSSATATDYNKYVPNARQVGSGDLHLMIWNAYTAILYAPSGKYSSSSPLALELQYHTDIKGEDIVDRTIKEIKAQGFNESAKLSTWKAQLVGIFPDVHEGTVLTGIKTDKGLTIFLSDGQQIGIIDDKEFGQKFFDIWLGEKTSQPKLRKKLLGLSYE